MTLRGSLFSYILMYEVQITSKSLLLKTFHGRIAMTDLLFSKRALYVLKLAQQEARRMKHAYVGTEHILLGLMRSDKDLVIRLGVSLEAVRDQIGDFIGYGVRPVEGIVPPTPNATRVLKNAVDEVGTSYVDVQHILMSLLREEHCVALIVLKKLSVDVAKILQEASVVSHDTETGKEAMYQWALQQSRELVPQLEAARRQVAHIEKQQNRFARILATCQGNQARQQ